MSKNRSSGNSQATEEQVKRTRTMKDYRIEIGEANDPDTTQLFCIVHRKEDALAVRDALLRAFEFGTLTELDSPVARVNMVTNL